MRSVVTRVCEWMLPSLTPVQPCGESALILRRRAKFCSLEAESAAQLYLQVAHIFDWFPVCRMDTKHHKPSRLQPLSLTETAIPNNYPFQPYLTIRTQILLSNMSFFSKIVSVLTCGRAGKAAAQESFNTYEYTPIAEVKEKPVPQQPKYVLRAPSIDGTQDFAIIYG